jgi:hypothetical protein
MLRPGLKQINVSRFYWDVGRFIRYFVRKVSRTPLGYLKKNLRVVKLKKFWSMDICERMGRGEEGG